MPLYTTEDLLRGSGAHDQAMRTQTEIPGFAARPTAGYAIGILASAMKSGMPADMIDKMIKDRFAPIADTLRDIEAMYEGDNWAIKLWHRQQFGNYKLCTDLCRIPTPTWRYSRAAQDDDL